MVTWARPSTFPTLREKLLKVLKVRGEIPPVDDERPLQRGRQREGIQGSLEVGLGQILSEQASPLFNTIVTKYFHENLLRLAQNQLRQEPFFHGCLLSHLHLESASGRGEDGTSWK